ncbi:(d)CMP kinase [Gluconacetobacter entanii]|uniref:Cytidylate kinase n=1 Tax=Gluconacetobacter entanii TaxID=108528 RepID=A0ABT3K6G7_9PROT|nr:(d)CMP kinase [Gluconacetobacter entanii]MBE7618556.1 (d)CMP kinase [Komagataeibacter sp. FXV2]MCE2577020.1 (d)CMP kinase [Komagataeibacter sp. FNDCR1]MBY4639557.1 (d)CMP kinase [Gluconacetobacter entanii]MCW4579852.1 (d)CMP kinase [Gluconacetobacter entanii]MCW4583297.1 (d)CMP kinase [Gluconacetobacter entanii]
MTAPLVIAVDGPAAAGKGTLAQRLARALDLPYLDTGLLYRATGRRMLDAGLDPASPADAQARLVTLGDLSRTDLRVPQVDRAASLVASQPTVRRILVGIQRDFAARHGAVLDGRDIGTVIFPDARVKLFVTASLGARARRRWEQMATDPDAPDREAQIARVAQELQARDAADSSRAAAPLRAAPDAIHIETDDMSADEVLAEALRIVADMTR